MCRKKADEREIGTMAIQKPLHSMILEEINDELEFAAVGKTYKRIDHARNALKKAVDGGKALYVGTEPFYDEAKIAELAAAEKAATATPKAEKAATPKKSVVFPEDLAFHELVGKTVFCRFGRQTVEAVGHVEGKADKQKARLGNGKIVAVTACRLTAVRSEYRRKYSVDKTHKTASGKPSIGVEDQITDLLKGANIETIKAVCAENDLSYDRWAGLNPGMQRMCLGNRLRGMAQKGKRVVIGGTVVAEGALDEASETGAASSATVVPGAASEASSMASAA